jgi:hypothetical protein
MTYVWKITQLSLFTQNNIYIWHRLKVSLKIYRIHDILHKEHILHDVLRVECGWKVCDVKVSSSCINLLQLLKLNWSFSMFLVFSFSHTQFLIYVTCPVLGGSFCKYRPMMLNIFTMYSRCLIIKYWWFECMGT